MGYFVYFWHYFPQSVSSTRLLDFRRVSKFATNIMPSAKDDTNNANNLHLVNNCPTNEIQIVGNVDAFSQNVSNELDLRL